MHGMTFHLRSLIPLTVLHIKINTGMLQNVPSFITIVHAVTSMCEVALLLQHVP